jgi:protein phosphatase
MFNLKNNLRHFPVEAQNSREGFELVAYGATDQGSKRGENEDSFLLLQLNDNAFTGEQLECLMAVADGLGHDKRGQVASQMAVDILRHSFYLSSVKTPMQRLVSGLEIANQRIFNQAEHDPYLKGMATTLTGVYIKDETAYVAHIGNSRAYLIRDGEIRQLTKDHTLAQVLMEIGDTGSHDISKFAYKTLLLAVGNEPVVEIWKTSVELEANDLLLVCSDGLTAHLTETEVRQIVEDNAAQPEMAVRRLIDKANELGGDDNITAIVAQFRYLARKNLPVTFQTEWEVPLVCRAAA